MLIVWLINLVNSCVWYEDVYLMVFMAMVNVDVKVKNKMRCSILDCKGWFDKS